MTRMAAGGAGRIFAAVRSSPPRPPSASATMPPLLRRPAVLLLPSLAVALAVAPAAAAAQAPATSAARPTSALAWMAGCWQRRAGTRLVEEQWMAPRGGLMLGASRTTRGDTLVEYEALRIEEAGDTLVYVASPSRQATTRFRAAGVRGDTVRFEDPTHDFPQRVGYVRRGADSLVAWIEGTQNGHPRRVEFPYARVECPG